MDIHHLVKQANGIGDFFDSEPDKAVAADGVRFHMTRFWDPRMRREIVAHVNAGGAGLEPTARRAVEQLAERPNSPNQSK